MLRFVWRKMMNNKWMVLCLLLGVVLAVGMVSSIPMFTDGVLNRVLRRDMEQYQMNTRVFPGRLYYKLSLDPAYSVEKRVNALGYFDGNLPDQVAGIGIPVRGTTRFLTVSTFQGALPGTEPDRNGRISRIPFKIGSLEGFEERVSFLYGQPPASTARADGVYEVAISYSYMVKNGLKLGDTYECVSTRAVSGESVTMFFQIVGVYEVADPSDIAWNDGGARLNNMYMMNLDAFYEAFIDRQANTTLITTAEYYYALDYQSVTIERVQEIQDALLATQSWFTSISRGTTSIPMINLLESYGPREQQLRTMLTILQVPILLMLAFYTFMISQLIVQYERNEIAVLRSRGAKRIQIVGIYLLESTIIGAVAFVLGLVLGYNICKVLGAANGFLEFVSRTSLTISVNQNAVFYAFITVLFSIVTMALPAIGYSRTTIVEHKTAKSRRKIALWKKMGLDFLLLAAAFYGLYSYNVRQSLLGVSGVDANVATIDPLLFLISTLFIIGAGLLFLRIFPYLVRLVYFIGRKIWSPVLYASFLQVGRSTGQEQFIMLFLVMTLSVGLFSANAARTFNSNTEERIGYGTGADIVITPLWPSDSVVVEEGSSETTYSSDTLGYANAKTITYREPSFAPYEQLDGVEAAAKVFVKAAATTYLGGSVTKSVGTTVMGIDSYTFGQTAAMPSDLLEPHWYYYLNLLTADPTAALLSRATAEANGLSVGDTIQVTWNSQTPIELRIYALIDYWPTYNPVEARQGLVVCNLNYIQAKMATEPYQVWLKKAEGATSQQVYDSILEQKIQVEDLTDATQDLITAKNDPLLQGVNGALTMGFIVTMVVCAMGFIIYWVLSIKGRVLQFGILRAMGLSMNKVIGMLLTEQLLISGSAIVFGVFTGAAASELYVPLLSMVYSAAELVPPFRVVMMRADYLKLYAILGVMLAVAFLVLGTLISRIRMAQALKLGED